MSNNTSEQSTCMFTKNQIVKMFCRSLGTDKPFPMRVKRVTKNQVIVENLNGKQYNGTFNRNGYMKGEGFYFRGRIEPLTPNETEESLLQAIEQEKKEKEQERQRKIEEKAQAVSTWWKTVGELWWLTRSRIAGHHNVFTCRIGKGIDPGVILICVNVNKDVYYVSASGISISEKSASGYAISTVEGTTLEECLYDLVRGQNVI